MGSIGAAGNFSSVERGGTESRPPGAHMLGDPSPDSSRAVLTLGQPDQGVQDPELEWVFSATLKALYE